MQMAVETGNCVQHGNGCRDPGLPMNVKKETGGERSDVTDLTSDGELRGLHQFLSLAFLTEPSAPQET
jgi:hypothetical protein